MGSEELLRSRIDEDNEGSVSRAALSMAGDLSKVGEITASSFSAQRNFF